MAQYKVPQDVEADDKLLGPFTFRQFVYLMITGGFIGVAFALFQIFPLLALLAVPFILFFGVLALPLKRDQPMETYLAAVVSYHLKPNKRFWNPGQRESTIEITAPKQVEAPRTRTISEEEAGNRLSFLANVIDTEGYAVRGDLTNAPMRAQFLAEANAVPDILDQQASPVINQMLAKQQNTQRQVMLDQMRNAIQHSEYAPESEDINNTMPGRSISPLSNTTYPGAQMSSAQFVNPAAMPMQPTAPPTQGYVQPTNIIASSPSQPNARLKDLAENKDFSIATISKEAARIEQQNQNGTIASY